MTLSEIQTTMLHVCFTEIGHFQKQKHLAGGLYCGTPMIAPCAGEMSYSQKRLCKQGPCDMIVSKGSTNYVYQICLLR